MASALLASRNEPYWGERKVYMRKNPNSSNSFRKSNPNPRNLQIYDHHHGGGRQAVVVPTTISDDSSSMIKRKPTINNNHNNNHHHHRREGGGGESLQQNGYVTFNISAYSKRELKDLKKRLISELEQVRNLNNRIESREIQSRSGYSVSHFSGGGGGGGYGGGGGREVTSATTTTTTTARPPPLHVSFSDSDGLKEKRTTPRTMNFTRQSEMPPLPPESKKISGNKRPNPFASSTRDLKRPATTETGKHLTTMMKSCGQILTKLMKSKTGYVFNVPVDVIGMKLHDYHQVIRNPMDLGTVKYRFDNNLYETPSDFASDVRLTFDNALIYNPKGHEVFLYAEQLLNRFNALFEPPYKKFQEEEQRCIVAAAGEVETMRRNSSISFEEEEDDEGLPSPRSSSARTTHESKSKPPSMKSSKQTLSYNPPPRPPPPPPPVVAAPAPAPQTMVEPPAPMAVEAPRPSFIGRPTMGKLPKPKAKDPNKREMSYDEKQKLSAHLMALPEDKMSQALQIVKRRQVVLLEKGDEVELDFEVLDRETLWELDRFVCNFRKMLSKVRRQAGFGNQNHTTSDGSKSPVSEIPEVAPVVATATATATATSTASVKNKRVENVGGEEDDVDIGEDIPTSSFPPVEIEKEEPGNASSGSSSSSSSSSGDSSSSSDSDSGSSSGSDSDADEAQSPLMEPKGVVSSPRR